MTTKTELTWYQLDHDTSNPASVLIFGQMWWADIDRREFYNVSPVNDPIENRKLWALDYCVREIGRYESLQEAQDAAESHQETLKDLE